MSSAEYQREYQRKRRARAEAEGLCLFCTKRPREDRLKQCRECCDKRNSYAKARYEGAHAPPEEWCIECQACGFHRDGCPADPVTARRSA